MAGRRGVCAQLQPARVDASCWAWKLAQTAQAIVWRPGSQRLLVIKFEVLSGRLVEKAQRLCHMMSVSQATFIYFCPKRVCERAGPGAAAEVVLWGQTEAALRGIAISFNGLTHWGERLLHFKYAVFFPAVKTILQQFQSR